MQLHSLQIESLEYLSLGNNKLVGFGSELDHLPFLRYLDLNGNRIENLQNISFNFLKRLGTLMLEDKSLTCDCQSIEDMSKLKLSSGICNSSNRSFVLFEGKCVGEGYQWPSLAVDGCFMNYRALIFLLMMHVILIISN